ncbi:MAG: R3H domain-containing nucleic acid-binding protein [Candidatus Woesebacteria bacterium]
MIIQDFVTQLLAHMGTESARVEIEETDESVVVHLFSDENESGLLIGHHAETLDALQHILRLLFQKDFEQPIMVNINDFRQEREEYLKNLARRVADRVIESGRPQVLRLSANERRIIHMTLADDPSVTTESEGEGAYRVLKIVLKS